MLQADNREKHNAGKAASPMPLAGLLALSTTAFLTILTETMPAALLPAMSQSLEATPASIGLLVSAYALASAAVAIPVVALTRRLPRRPLYIVLVLIFAAANAMTALSNAYALTLASRIVAGIAAGVVWPVICGYAIRLVSPAQMGRAVAITLAGSTVAMVAGLPLGTLLGEVLGWRATYAALSALALLVIGWVLLAVPAVQQQAQKGPCADASGSAWHVLRTPGLRPILCATFLAMTGHYALYTYMAPLADALQLPGGVGRGLLLFGLGAVFGVVLAGRLVDQRGRLLALCALGCGAAVIGGLLAGPTAWAASAALLMWGLSFGGLPTVFQASTGQVASGQAELATAMLTTIYNLGIFAGGAVGGTLLGWGGVQGLQVLALLAVAGSMVIVASNRRHAFPG
ncbi:MFS transporter [Xanthomonas campestris pv. plantaginis]|uniref:MFS transporter n=1 Tax=Xanthomonas campestris TaxID=339 RepID=UPI002B23ADCD|nr:MFS transporter [Xanthomonas campestris]MEA9608875.1 MFS transporter [Xanthomonas campestris pv. plantaginis]